MHDLFGDKTVPPEQASDYFDVVREFYSGIPDVIILKLGGGDAMPARSTTACSFSLRQIMTAQVTYE